MAGRQVGAAVSSQGQRRSGGRTGRAGQTSAAESRKRSTPRSSEPAKAKRGGGIRRRRRTTKPKLAVLWVVLIGASAVTGAGVGLAGLWLWGQEPASGTGYAAFEIGADDTLSHISEHLEELDLVRSAGWFSWFKRVYAGAAVFEPGQHLLSRGAEPRELIQQLARRQGRHHLRVNLPEGWDSFQIARRLADEGICGQQAFLKAVFDRDLAQDVVGQDSFEGYLYPASYDLRVNSAPEWLVEKLASQGLSRFRALSGEAGVRGLSMHQLVTLASVVEKEAADTEELPLVASVFFNRLEDPQFRPLRMLQSDPTAGYGCKLPSSAPSCRGFDGRITAAMLRDAENPYNTYKHPGLPPGPIGNPSAEAVQAVIGAPRTKYYFFVAGPSGRHVFSQTLQEHRRAIQGKD